MPTSRSSGWFVVPGFAMCGKGTEMTRFTRENAAAYGRCGGQKAHQQLEQQYADLVLTTPATAARVAQLIRQGYRLVMALRVVTIVERMDQGGR